MLSVIIVNYNAGYRLKQAIDSLLAFPVRRGIEIVVVENESTDGSSDFLAKDERYAGVKLIHPGVNVGYTEGNNIGYDHATGDLVLLMTPDRYALGDSVDRMVQRFDEDPSIGAIGGFCYKPDGTVDHHFLELPGVWMSYLWCFWMGRGAQRLRSVKRHTHAEEDLTKPFDCAQPAGGCYAFRRRLVDPPVTHAGFGLMFGDVETARRVADSGLRTVVFPDVKFVHDHDERPSNPVRGPFVTLDYYVGIALYHRLHNGLLAYAAVKALFGIHLTAWMLRETAALLLRRQTREQYRRHAQIYASFWRDRNVLLEATKEKMRAAGLPRAQ